MQKRAIIIGAGPAGLTAAFELLAQNTDVAPIVLEATSRIGGISCTINYNGNRIDIGGHRFFSKSDRVMEWWTRCMPVQGRPSRDDAILGRKKSLAPDGPDPEKMDRVMLLRERISRILYLRRFFDYPITLKFETVANLGLARTLQAGWGYFLAQVFKGKNEVTLEDFLINRFGKPLYGMFFEDYTEKVWGVHPRCISADWGAQRIKGLSFMRVLTEAAKKVWMAKDDGDVRQKKVETSLIGQFYYPKLGPGQLWEYVALDIAERGGEMQLSHRVKGIEVRSGKVVQVEVEAPEGVRTMSCDYLLSSMPLRDLVNSLKGDPIPSEVVRIANGLPYRDFMTVGILAKRFRIANQTKRPTVRDIIPDTWIYIQEPDVRLCRLQIFNNWSPYMVADPDNIWIGLEYMCSEQDNTWSMSDADFIALAVDEVVKIGLIDRADILDTCRIRIEKAYPAYFGTYGEIELVRDYLNSIDNLYCLGRNGQHRYNNQDHSMLTAMEAVRCIREGDADRTGLWTINSEQEYHEKK